MHTGLSKRGENTSLLPVLIICLCFRAILEDGDPIDTAPLLQAGLILESFGSFEEAAVRRCSVWVCSAQCYMMVHPA